jgi:hypothetical protein
VHPGDTIHVLIKQKSIGQWFIEIDNRTTGKSFTKSQAYPGLGGSAEWIEETPLELGTNAGLSALPDLTTVPFSGAKANGGNANLNASQAMDLIDANGNVIGVPSAPNATHNGFDACAWATTCS